MKTYVVGGSVRDRLLGLPIQDRDHVVVGATPEMMSAQGFKPVGADFPVFLHPSTHEEYALARTERKSGKGYKGFTVYASPEVTLEEDLARRDLTINAMAEDETGTLVDPYGGRHDLAARVLRHVGPAFAEDPVRILRVARFAARFADRGFAVAPETMELMRRMVSEGEADHLVPERVWQEIARGLTEARPSALFRVLRETGALARIAPEWEAVNVPEAALDDAATNTPLDVRFTVLCATLPEAAIVSLCERLRTPADCRDLAVAFARARAFAIRLPGLSAEEACTLFDALDALRRPDRLERFQLAWALSQRARGVDHAVVARHAAWIDAGLGHLRAIDFGAVAARANGRDIPGAIRAAKLAALQSFLDTKKDS